MRKFKYLATVLFLIIVIFALLACNSNGDDILPDKPQYQTILQKTNESQNKAIDTNANVKFVFYKPDGTPCRIVENFFFNRSTDGHSHYLYAEAETTEISKYVQDLVSAIVALMQMSGNEKPLVAIQDYLFTRKYIALKAGKHNDTVNAQVELVEKDMSPQFVFSEDGQEIVDFKAAWGAAKYSDFLDFQQTASVDYVKEFDLLGTVYDVISIPFDWTKAVDSIDNKPVQFNNYEYMAYNLSFSDEEIKNFIKSQMQFYIAEFLGDNQEDYDFVNGLYSRNIDTIMSLFEIGNFKQLSYVDDDFRLVHTETSWQIVFKFDFQVFRNILLGEGVNQEDVDQIISIFDLINSTFIGNSSKQTGHIEFGLLFDIKEDYSYDSVVINLNDSIFTDFDAEESGRYTIEYVYDEEREADRWIPVNVPGALKILLDDESP